MFDWVSGFVEEGSYPAIALLMLAENAFPPIPSELIIPLAGFAAARGELSLPLVVIAGSTGSLLGATLWYYIGCWLGTARLKRWTTRHGRWMTVTPGDIDKACAWFDRHGGKTVLLGRMVPAVRTFISVPAGIAGMRFRPFLIYTTVGTVLWTSLLALVGFVLEDQYRHVASWTNPISNIVLGILVVWYLYRVAVFPRAR